MGMIARPDVGLDDKYTVTEGTIFITGVQALVRLPLFRRRLDEKLGLRTAGFISGYRGSPLGTYDSQLQKARRFLEANEIVVKPAINEDLGATAIWGCQQVGLHPGARYDGVFGIWYGKGPGVDRSGDAFKHANFAGTSRWGGVLALAGDDHACKSSTMPNQSEFAFADAEIPVLNPTGVEELLLFGMKGLALSRYAGLWVGMKTIADTMDSTAVIDVSLDDYATQAPGDFMLPADGLNIRLIDTPAAAEERHRHFRLPAAQAFARANGLDRIVLDSPRPRIGIAATGKAYLHVRQALRDIGLSDAQARDVGLRLYKIGLSWPLDRVSARAFAEGLEEIIVVEERRDLIEHQLKAALYDLPEDRRPRIVGKHDERGGRLLRDILDLDTGHVAAALLARFPEEWKNEHARAYERSLSGSAKAPERTGPLHARGPFFCSGCPHNTSTRLPENSRAIAGIGCHFLVQWMDRRSETCTHMGAEGVPWIGQSPFTEERHIFANLGDGTYFHSGSLAIRQAIAAGVNITYKILYNDAVAMTGGQAVDGTLTVPMIVAQMVAEGVKRIAIVSDDPDRHKGDPLIPSWVSFDHRDRLDEVQKALRDVPGCSILVYDQTCATEKRRRRKRGTLPAEEKRLIINTAVCEGCGDCTVKSNCLSIEPIETEFGRKRRIDQSSCNKDFSCVNGFCPSFVSVSGARPKAAANEFHPRDDLPEPQQPPIEAQPWNVLLAGIGGQGVTALAGIIGMAAHLEGKRSLLVDQLGMAQKGGGVTSHIRIGHAAETSLHSPRIGPGQTDLLIASDIVVAHGKAVLPSLDAGRARGIVNLNIAPTGEFVRNNDIDYDLPGMRRAIARHVRVLEELRAHDIVTAVLGDAIYLNIFLLGYAYQKGWMPLGHVALERAIELNGTAVEANRKAFRLGRHYAVDAQGILSRLPPSQKLAQSFDEIVAHRYKDLVAYQSRAYAEQYRSFVTRVRAFEAERIGPDSEALGRTIARMLYKLMAYKDEYEVARLYTDGRFVEQLTSQFEGQSRLRVHLAPPLLSHRDPDTGLPAKRAFGPWIFPALHLLARLKFLRGTPFDVFGRTDERRKERALIHSYRALVEDVILPGLSKETCDLALDLAALPEMVRGFGHVKLGNLQIYETRLAELCERHAVLAASRGEHRAYAETAA